MRRTGVRKEWSASNQWNKWRECGDQTSGTNGASAEIVRCGSDRCAATEGGKVWLGSMCSYCRLCIDVQLLKAARCRVAATNDALRRTDSM